MSLPSDPRFAEGIRLFVAEEWFEAHEVLEAVWRETPRGPDRELLQGLIQLAVASEHWRRGNPRGSRGQWDKARGHLAGLPDVVYDLALGELLASFEHAWERVGLHAAVEAQAQGGFVPGVLVGWPAPRWVAGQGPPSR